MRKITIKMAPTAAEKAVATERGEYAAANRSEAEDLAPWAADIIEVDGGWIAFEDTAEAATWANQR